MPDRPDHADPLTPRRPERLDGSEVVADGRATVVDFWRWAFSDVRENTTRGVFAEWLVGLALGCVDGVRAGWDDVDLVTAQGTRVEVKSAAHLQAWPTRESSPISFGRLSGRAWDAAVGVFAAERTYRADIYVFAVLTTLDHALLDPLDVAQWRFWIASKTAVQERGSRSLSLAGVQEIARGPIRFEELADAVHATDRGDG